MKGDTIIIDARGRSLGRVASEAASHLRGKSDPRVERHLKPQTRVIVKNANLVRVTGKKMIQEKRERYSGYPGGLKRIPYRETFAKDSRKLLSHAIFGMLPKNRLTKGIMKNLIIYGTDNQ